MRNSIILPILFGSICATIIFIGFNWYCSYRFKTAGHWHKNVEVDFDKNLKNFVVPQDIFKDLKKIPKYSGVLNDSVELNTDRKAFVMHENPNSTYRSVVTIKATGENVYDHKITLNDKGRRVVEAPHLPSNDTAVVFLGCSFTFGEGVDDFEAFPSKLSRKLRGANTYNLGIGASSANEIYYDMNNRRKDFFKSIPEKNIILVYTFIESHLVRQACDLTCYSYNKWMLNKPKYQIDKNGNLEYRGTLKNYFSPNILTDLFFSLPIFKYYDFHGFTVDTDENVFLFASLMKSIRSEYEKNHIVQASYIYIHESSPPAVANKVVPQILQNNFIPIIGDKKYLEGHFSSGLFNRYDFHPNNLGHEVSARSIGHFLKVNHPELF